MMEYVNGLGFSNDSEAVFGCTEPGSTNYDPNATNDDYSCVLPCTLEIVIESVSPACYSNNGSISVTSTGAQGSDDYYLGEDDEQPSNFGNFNGLLSGSYYVMVEDGAGCQASQYIEIEAGCLGCIDETACNYDPSAVSYNESCDFVSCLDECGVLNGNNSTCMDDCGVPNGDNSTCSGCIIDIACNYDPEAIVDDGSCEFLCYGCIDLEACNFEPTAFLDDESCEYDGYGGFPRENLVGDFGSFFLNKAFVNGHCGFQFVTQSVVQGVGYPQF